MSDRKTVYGAYFYPPLFFERIPMSFEEIFAQIELPYSPLEKPIRRFAFSNYEVFVDSTGFIWTNQPDKEVSEAILNSIFLATTLLKGYAVRLVNQKELTRVHIDPTINEDYPRDAEIVTERGWLHIFSEMRREFNKVILTADEFKVILDLATNIFRSHFKTTILTFFECYTMFDRGNFTGSILFGWITIESYLNHKLEAYLLSKDVSQKEIDQRKEKWPAFKKINYLKDKNVISDAEADDLHKLRTIRNEILHEENKPTEGEAIACKKVATDVMWELFRMEKDIDYSTYFTMMEAIKQNSI